MTLTRALNRSIGKRQMVRKYSKAVLRPPEQMEQTALSFPLPRRGKAGTWTSSAAHDAYFL